MPRCGALMLQVEGFLLVLGGMNTHEEALDEVFVIDIEGGYDNFRNNAEFFGVSHKNNEPDVVPPPIPKEYLVSRRYLKKQEFNPNTFA